MHFIELKKFNKDLAHLTTALDRWTVFLSKAEQWENNFIPQELKDEPGIGKAVQVLDTLSLNDEEREIYEAQLKWLRDEASIIEKTRLDAESKGKEEVALRMIKKGHFSLEEIVEISDLTREQVQKIL